MRKHLAALLLLVVAVSWARSSIVAAAEVLPTPGTTGYDFSFPQCGTAPTTRPAAFVIVGATGGKPFQQNPCLATQYAWASAGGRQAALYLNLKSPIGTNSEESLSGPRGNCRPEERACQAYNFGWKSAQHGVVYAATQRATPPTWWLDVETMNTWSSDTAMNALVIGGAIDYLKSIGVTIGIYSSQMQWAEIAGSYAPGLPVWVAAAPHAAAAPTYCSKTFGGGQVALVQYIVGNDDMNYACTAADRTIVVNNTPLGPPGSSAVVASDGDCLNLRPQPGLSGTASTCLASGSQVTLLDGSVMADGYRWLRISAGSATGWAASTFLRGVPPGTAPVAPIVPVAVVEPPTTRGKITTGSVPVAGGFGLVVFGGGTSTELVTASGCPATSAVFWASNAEGGFDGYVPGTTIAIVNAAWTARFGEGIPEATPLLGRCK